MKKIFIFIILICSFFANAQSNDYIKDPFEKVILHTDRDLYLTEEKIWFNAYCHINDTLITNNISNILYVEIFDNNRESVLSQKFYIKDGKANGCLDIPADFKTGNYSLRAYTQFLKNFPVENYFTTLITIINPKNSIKKTKNKIHQKSSIDENKFNLRVNKTAHELELFVINKGLADEFKVSLLNQDLKQLTETNIYLGSAESKLRFAKDLFSNGLYYFLVKNKVNTIVGIHAIHYKGELLKVNLGAEKKTFSPREKINLSLSNNTNQLMDVSVSVVKRGTTNDITAKMMSIMDNPEHLRSFLMSASNTALLNENQMNFLMSNYNRLLNNHKSRFAFHKNVHHIPFVPEIRDVSISGVVYSKTNNNPVKDVPVFVASFGEVLQMHIFNTKEDGKFLFSLNNFVNDQNLYISTNHPDFADLEIRINNDFLKDYPKSKISELVIDSTYRSLLEEMFINRQANTSFKTYTRELQNPKDSFPYVFATPDETYRTDDFVFTPTLEMFFREIVTCIRVRKRKDDFTLFVCDADNIGVYESPLLMVDNLPMFNTNAVMKILPSVIDKIEIHKKQLILKDQQINGVIKITTNTDNFGGIKLPNNAIFLNYKTISDSYKFVSPEYTNSSNIRKADFRTLLYWNPEIKLKDSETVSFYASDHCSEYDIIVRGYTEDGKECYGKASISIEK